MFYPAWDRLPAIHPVVWSLMASQKSVELGGILVTRLLPGGRILRHSDAGAWHAERYNCKCCLVLEANARCIVECDGDEEVFRAGEIFELDNLRPHSMENGGTTQRTALIVSLRVERVNAYTAPLSLPSRGDPNEASTAAVADAGTIH